MTIGETKNFLKGDPAGHPEYPDWAKIECVNFLYLLKLVAKFHQNRTIRSRVMNVMVKQISKQTQTDIPIKFSAKSSIKTYNSLRSFNSIRPWRNASNQFHNGKIKARAFFHEKILFHLFNKINFPTGNCTNRTNPQAYFRESGVIGEIHVSGKMGTSYLYHGYLPTYV
jgi:hypothetical protein